MQDYPISYLEVERRVFLLGDYRGWLGQESDAGPMRSAQSNGHVTHFRSSMFVAWCSVFGLRCLVLGVWCSVFGVWALCLVFGALCFVPSAQ